MKILFIIILAVHGLVHMIGFLRAFHITEGKGYVIPVSKPMGILWLATFILFEAVAIMFYLDFKQWWIYGSVAVVLSQFLIIYHWQDAKFGTIVNILILFIIVLDYGSWHFRNNFIKEVRKEIHSSVI